MRSLLLGLTTLCWCLVAAGARGDGEMPSLADVKAQGARRSMYLTSEQPTVVKAPRANLTEYRKTVQPLLRDACYACHGSDVQEGGFRVDTLNPNLLEGEDVAWWIEVFDVLSKGEMPPANEAELPPKGRSQIVEWLSRELQVASQVARTRQGDSAFRRMTRYEYNYALQDLLGLPYDFAKDLPPEAVTEEGFANSSEMLQISASQLETYRISARQALQKATVRGEQPAPVNYAISMKFDDRAAKSMLEADLKRIRKRFVDRPEKLKSEIVKRTQQPPRGTYYKNRRSGLMAAAKWSYHGARYAHAPVAGKTTVPSEISHVAVLPVNQRLIVDLGDHLPNAGVLRMKVRAKATPSRENWVPTLRVYFGHQASNDSRVEEPVGEFVVSRSTNSFVFHELQFPLSEVMRNVYRGKQKLGDLPNPAEFIKLVNVSGNPVDIQIDFIEIIAPYYAQWPPQSHRLVFPYKDPGKNLSQFMQRAWRRPVSPQELKQKLKLYRKLLPQCDSPQDAMTEVFASVLASPQFLYLNSNQKKTDERLATRLAIFLWCSLPDQQLLDLAATGTLSSPQVLDREIERMLNDPRAKRFSRHFVQQWLGMQLLNYVKIEGDLREAMHEEPIAFFDNILADNRTVMDFLHSDYTMVNSRLAKHYGIPEIYGNHFRRVPLPSTQRRGGLLTQAGLLAMNSDGNDSHPLKRGIWLLESLLNDPPPPPPPAVPEIDLTDPDILKLTLKERIEDHRNKPACLSCHQRIDPWGIAFENFDAVGLWRNTVAGKPVDARSVLFNRQELDGMDGLKRYLLANRQDQFARAMTHKLMTFALGRPLSFADRAEVDRITGSLRKRGDGLRTLIHLIVSSDLFHE